jgi:hypothetical protein
MLQCPSCDVPSWEFYFKGFIKWPWGTHSSRFIDFHFVCCSEHNKSSLCIHFTVAFVNLYSFYWAQYPPLSVTVADSCPKQQKGFTTFWLYMTGLHKVSCRTGTTALGPQSPDLKFDKFNLCIALLNEHFCGLLVRAPSYRSRGPGFDSRRATWKKSSSSGLEIREYGRRDPSHWPRGTLYPKKLALTSPTSGSRSVGRARLRTKATEFVLFCLCGLL